MVNAMIRSKIEVISLTDEKMKEIYAENVPRVGDNLKVEGEPREVREVTWERLKPPQVTVIVG